MMSSHSKVLVIELFTEGATPYGDITLEEVIQRVGAGERLPKPSSMPTTTYLLLMSCWDVDPAARPSFSQLQQTLSQNEGSNCKDSWQLRELDGRASSDKVYGDGRLSAISLLEMMPNSKLNTMDRLEREILSNISAPPRRASTPFDTEKSSFFTGAYAYAHATKKPTQKNNKVGPDLPPLLPQAPRVQVSASADGAGVSGSSRLVKVMPTPRPALAIAGRQPPPTTMPALHRETGTDCDSAEIIVVGGGNDDAVYVVPDGNASVSTTDGTYAVGL